MSSPSLSLVLGPTTPKLWNKRLGAVIEEQAQRYGDHIAASFPWQEVQLSYRDLFVRSNTMAKAMLASGLKHGECVAIMAGNCFQYIEAFLGASLIGCPYVVLNNTYSAKELVEALRITSAKLLFIADNIGMKPLSSHIEQVTSSVENVGSLKCIVRLSESQSIQANRVCCIIKYGDFMSRSSTTEDSVLGEAQRNVKATDVLNIQFTSGTTGSPKAAMLTHNNILNNGRFVGAKMKFSHKDVVACPPPLFHCFGLVMGFLASFTHGSKIVFPSDQFQAEQALDEIYKERCTAVLGVPTMFIAILEANRKRRYRIRSLRTGLAAGSSVPVVLMKQLQQELGLDGMLIAYGMTETSPVTFITSLDDNEERRTRTVGNVMHHTVAKVVDRSGNIVQRGTPGELLTSGYALQKGYLNNEAKTKEVMKADKDGVIWMHTGDECVIDQSGYCSITGRIKDLIIRGGENIFPLEIEERLLQHPSIAEASVVAIKDDRYGEVVGAFLKRSPGSNSRPNSEEVSLWVRERLGSHKSPRYCFWIGDAGVGDDFPKTGSGKYQKHLLRELGDKLVASAAHRTLAMRSKL